MRVYLSNFISAALSPLQHNTDVVFSIWDMAGQEVYYATHQCFLSRNTLYLVVWNMEEGDKGIDYLRPWLLNIQASRVEFEGGGSTQITDKHGDGLGVQIRGGLLNIIQVIIVDMSFVNPGFIRDEGM